ncbi:MAG: methyl-accepting chemotaxis protein [Oscillospiraceae bacterium]|nr:methyl-accepting chemotaxis protein [Oscillospiraceae bacterium]
MSWFKNLKVRAKMITAFTGVIILMAALSVFSIVEMNNISSSYTYAIEHPIEAETQMHIFDTHLGNLRRATTTMALFAFANPDSVKNYTGDANDAYDLGLQAIAAAEHSVLSGNMNEKAQSFADQLTEIKGKYARYKTDVCDPVAKAAAEGDSAGAMGYIGAGVDLANDLAAITKNLTEISESSANANIKSAEESARATIVIVVGASLGVAVISVIIALYIAAIISKPLKPLAAFMNKAGSTGNLHMSPADAANVAEFSIMQDEIGQTIKGCASFVQHISVVAQELESIAKGDLTTHIAMLSDEDEMGISLSRMVKSLNQMFSEINSSTEQVSHGSKQVADGAQSLAQGSTTQAASIEELSSSISEIAEKTKTNAVTADKTAKLAESIMSNAEKGSRQMDEMMTAVQEINQASQNISKVIKVIDDIAFQTNILALNAAVEAARAGAHGKGFAVVAEEVRNLAGKSAEAAKETGDMIQNSMAKAELGTRIAGETAASLTDIVAGINESSEYIREIARASDEQSTGISQINTGIDQVAQIIQQNSATAEQSAAASEQMSGQSSMLQDLIAQFKLK